MTVSITFTGETEADIRRQAAEFGSETAQRALQQVDTLTREVGVFKAASRADRVERDFLRNEVGRLKADVSHLKNGPIPDWAGWRSPDSGAVDVSDDRRIIVLGRDNRISPPIRASVLCDPDFRRSIRAFAEVPKPKGWWRP
jgi:hypothetical protein